MLLHVARQAGGHGLGQFVHLRQRPTQRLGDVAQGEAQPVGDEGCRHRCLFDAEALLHPADDLVAAVGVEVDVDVGCALAASVEEALEEQVVADRVDGGDAEQVGDDAVGRRTAPCAANAAGFGFGHHLVYDEEELGQFESTDDQQFFGELCPCHGLTFGFVQPGEAGVAKITEQLVGGDTSGNLRRRRRDVFGHQIDTAALGDLDGALEGVGAEGQQTAQLGLGLEVRFGIARPLLVRLGDGVVEAHAGEQVVASPVGGRGVAHVVGDHSGHRLGDGEFVEALGDATVLRQQPVGELDVEGIAEDIVQRGEPGARAIETSVGDVLPQPPLAATRQAEQPSRECRQVVECDGRYFAAIGGQRSGRVRGNLAVIENYDTGCRQMGSSQQLAQVAVATRVARQQYEGRAVDDDLGAEHGVQTGDAAGLLQTHGAVDAMTVGEGQRRLTEARGVLHKVGRGRAAGEKTEPAACVQVNEHEKERAH